MAGGQFRLCKVVCSAESRLSKSGSGLALVLGGRGDGLRGPRGRLPEALRDTVLAGCSLTSVSDVGQNRFVGVVDRWLRPLPVPEARDGGRNGSGGLSMAGVQYIELWKNDKYVKTFIYRVFDRSVPWRFC